jgi:hypothetical protein
MKLQGNFSRVQTFTLGLVVLVSILCAGVAQAAPAYRGKFTLPYTVRWGNIVVPAGDYRFGFEDVGPHAFVVIEDAKNRRFLGMVTATSVGDVRSENALLIADEGGHLVVRSLCLGELGLEFNYGSSRSHRAKEMEMGEAHATQVVPLTLAANSPR